MNTRACFPIASGWLHRRERLPDRDGASPHLLLEETARLPGTFRLALVGGCVELLGEACEGPCPSTTIGEEVTEEVVAGALESAGLPHKRREPGWVIPPGSQRLREVVLTPLAGGLRIESVLGSWDEVGPAEREAMARLLCRAQAQLRFARCELNDEQAVVAARLTAREIETGLPHAAAAILAAARLLSREVGALLLPEVAEGYMRFISSRAEKQPAAGRI
jgi:hypothetical protein